MPRKSDLSKDGNSAVRAVRDLANIADSRSRRDEYMDDACDRVDSLQ